MLFALPRVQELTDISVPEVALAMVRPTPPSSHHTRLPTHLLYPGQPCHPPGPARALPCATVFTGRTVQSVYPPPLSGVGVVRQRALLGFSPRVRLPERDDRGDDRGARCAALRLSRSHCRAFAPWAAPAPW